MNGLQVETKDGKLHVLTETGETIPVNRCSIEFESGGEPHVLVEADLGKARIQRLERGTLFTTLGGKRYILVPEKEAAQPMDRTEFHRKCSGALYSFAGFLTSRPESLLIGAECSGAPLTNLIEEFAARHGLDTNDPDMEWDE
jgi:hypothetical protein